MRLKITLSWIVLLGICVLFAQVSAEEVPVFKTEKAKLSYAVGVDWAATFNSQGFRLEPENFVGGFRDVFSGQKLLMTEYDLRTAMDSFQKMKEKRPQAERIPEYISYAIGVDAARNFKRQGAELDMDALVKGLRDVFWGKKPLITDRELRLAVNVFQAELRQKRTQARVVMAKKAENNKKEGDAYLAQNKMKEGVMTLPSGLQYKIIKAGEGKNPTDSDTVVVNYWGTLIDGTEFDSSYAKGQPATFKVSGVIPGWIEALKLMPLGSKWQLFVPSHLAYGVRGSGSNIGPNVTLVFEVELIAIK